jgi:SAM-dependent methyltransferase
MMNEKELESIPCPLCNSEEKKCAYDFKPYEVKRCLNCGFYYLSPRLSEEESKKFYLDDGYFDGGETGYTDINYQDQEVAFRMTFKALMKNMKKQGLTGGSLLEIGCAYGYLLDEAKEYFEYRAGTEFSDYAISMAEKRADKIYKGGVEALSKDERFDCIISVAVLEHVYRPKDFLVGIHERLKPNGKVVIAVPNMRFFWRFIMGRFWPMFKIPEHILYFDDTSLSTIMTQAGFTGLQRVPYPHAFPITLVTKKLGISLPKSFGKYNIMIPGVLMAMCGFRDG